MVIGGRAKAVAPGQRRLRRFADGALGSTSAIAAIGTGATPDTKER